MKWTCTVCGYTHEGPEPPAQCPQCKVPAEKFVKADEGEKVWGSYTYNGIDKENYKSGNQEAYVDKEYNVLRREVFVSGEKITDVDIALMVEDENKIVEIATLQTINTASWYANQHTLKFIDLVHNGNESLGYVYTENTKVYSIDNEISKEDFIQIIGD